MQASREKSKRDSRVTVQMKTRATWLAEWPTLAMIAATYSVWAIATTWLSAFWLPLGIVVTTIAIAQFSSLQHECLHGHPFKSAHLNAALVFPALTLCVPYLRFRDTHLDHHLDSRLTDPYDDPESNFLDPGDWERLPRWAQRIMEANNTLAGRILVGPMIGTLFFLRSDWKTRHSDPRVLRGWLWHIPALIPVVLWLAYVAEMPALAYLLCAYGGLGLLRIRTFLEHQAHEKARGRTVVIEDKGPLALLFLNNNYHAVHHMHPRVAWYRLPRLSRDNRDRYLARNDRYFFRSYLDVARQYLFRRKDPVPHPLWRRS
jgi:fatty acid desaturase